MAVTAPLSLLMLLAAAALADRCPPDTLAIYRAHLSTHWSRELFPKQYPEFRPPAQWSRLLGRSHDDTFELFSEGRLASSALKQFAELGKTDLFDGHRQGYDGVMDTFGAEPIIQGEGQSTAKFYLDNNHTKVSLVVRMVPSPDWFIGVNSISLCNGDGEWVDNKFLQLTLMDAGTDTGFTFTSPNWPSDPPQPISIITAHFPDHPASSFYYPDVKHLPVIATLQFTKVKVYKLKHQFHLDAPSHKKLVEVNEEEELLNNRLTVDGPSRPAATRILSGSTGQHILSIGSDGPRLIRNRLRSLRMGKNNRRRKQQMGEHCKLSSWSEWSPCSDSCGTGSSSRRRSVLKKGRQCPGNLEESTWCSSYVACSDKFFKW